MCLGPGLGFLPIILGILSTATFVATYCIAIVRGDVIPFFPYISDTGAKPPESCIFGEFLNISAFLAFLTMYVRYKMVLEFCHSDNNRVVLLNKIGLVLGILCSIGMTLVANFQETNVEPVHITGAVLVFGGGCLYCFIHVAISYKMCPDYCGHHVCRWRLGIATVATTAMAIAFIAAVISREQWDGQADKSHKSKLHWDPSDPGFGAHVTSTIAEWVMAISFMMYFFTYIRDFQKLNMDMKTVLYVTHLDQVPVNQPNETSRLILA